MSDWQDIAFKQSVALKKAVEQIKRLRKLEEAIVAYGNKYGFITETAEGETVSEGIEVFNQSLGYRKPGKVKKFRAVEYVELQELRDALAALENNDED